MTRVVEGMVARAAVVVWKVPFVPIVVGEGEDEVAGGWVVVVVSFVVVVGDAVVLMAS